MASLELSARSRYLASLSRNRSSARFRRANSRESNIVNANIVRTNPAISAPMKNAF